MTDLILIILLAAAVLWTVMTSRLLRSGVGLAVVSALLAILLYRLTAPTAAVFELSVCAGLIPVVFVTTISFTRRLKCEEVKAARLTGLTRYWYLPFVMGIAIVPLFLFAPQLDFPLPAAGEAVDVRQMLWGVRHLDLFGQVAVLLAGALAVAVFFKEARR